MTAAEFAQAADVIPWVTVGVVAQASYQVASLGLNITKQTKFFPVATGISAVISVGANLVLIPRFGFVGAAAATALSYSALTLLIGYFAARVYPVQYQWRRLGLVAGAGLLSYEAATILVPTFRHAAVGILLRGSVLVTLYVVALWVTGFLEPSELARLRAVWRSRGTPRHAEPDAGGSAEMGGELVGAAPRSVGEWPGDGGQDSPPRT